MPNLPSEIESWERCSFQSINYLFNYFEVATGTQKRVCAYQFSEADISAIQLFDPLVVTELKIWMGSTTDSPSTHYDNSPRFAPLLEVVVEGVDPYTHIYRPQWAGIESAGMVPKMVNGVVVNTVDPDVISSKTAMLFLEGWMENPDEMMADNFNGVVTGGSRLVRFYAYTGQSKDDILGSLRQNGTNSPFWLFCGQGLPVSSHPFGFRPVLKLGSEATRNEKYFDFSQPCPPKCS